MIRKRGIEVRRNGGYARQDTLDVAERRSTGKEFGGEVLQPFNTEP
jgi:hypothetical protein